MALLNSWQDFTEKVKICSLSFQTGGRKVDLSHRVVIPIEYLIKKTFV